MSEALPLEYSEADLAFIYDGPEPTDAELGIAKPVAAKRESDRCGQQKQAKKGGFCEA